MSFLERFFMTFRSPPKSVILANLAAGYVPVVGTQAAHENDVAAALAGAPMERASDLGGFEPPSLESLHLKVAALTAAHNDLATTMQLPQHVIPAA